MNTLPDPSHSHATNQQQALPLTRNGEREPTAVPEPSTESLNQKLTPQSHEHSDFRATLDHEPVIEHTRVTGGNIHHTGPTESKAIAMASEFGYELLGILGKGGMGIVYRAKQKTLGREVALKMVLDRALGDSDAMRRFDLEAKSLGRLQHPNIVQVYDFGVRPDGMPYFALEYCQGGSLADLMKKDTPSPKQAARLINVLARAMAVAHAAGIVHRDLKPGNVLLRAPSETMDGVDPTWLKIADFGLAKTTDDPEASRHTQTGGPMGTVLYMSPEQALNGAAAREPADIYSLGVILYEMLTGRVPFRGKTQREILKQLDEADPLPVVQLLPNCPADLNTICLKCLEKKAERRYSSSLALAEDLQAYLDDRPISARPVGQAEKTLKWMKRNPGRTTGIVAAVSMLVLMIAGTVVFYQERLRSEQITAEVRLEEQLKSSELQRQQDLANAEEKRAADEKAARDKYAAEQKERARGYIGQLATAAPDEIAELLKNIDSFSTIADPLILEELPAAAAITKTRLHLALVPRQSDLVSTVANAARLAPPGEMPSYANRLKPWAERLLPDFWQRMTAPETTAPERLRLATLLASWAPADDRWKKAGPMLASSLVDQNILELAPWLRLLEPTSAFMSNPLVHFHDLGSRDGADPQNVFRSETAAHLLATMAFSPEVLAKVATRANGRTFAIMADRLKDQADRLTPELVYFTRNNSRPEFGLAPFMAPLVPLEMNGMLKNSPHQIMLHDAACQIQARAIATLAFLNRPEHLFTSMNRIDAPDLQAELRAIAVPFRIPAASLADQYFKETNTAGRRHLLQLLGSYPSAALPSATLTKLADRLAEDFINDPDAGIHATIDWLLRQQWKQQTHLVAAVKKLPIQKTPQSTLSGWRVNSMGQTFTIVKSGKSFTMGAGADDPDRAMQGNIDLELKHTVEMRHGFEISSREVTLGEYRRFRPGFNSLEKVNPGELLDVPVTGVSWFDAIAYCQWLSEQEGIPESQWCFPRCDTIKSNIAIKADITRRTGYRLPTEQEWELVARAGNTMRYPCGITTRHINHHAITWNNGMEHLWVTGTKLPNDWGLFDTGGNALEWTMDEFRKYDDPYLKSDLEQALKLGFVPVSDNSLRAIRGGSFNNSPTATRMSARLAGQANLHAASNGFRICRTTIPTPPEKIKKTGGTPVPPN